MDLEFEHVVEVVGQGVELTGIGVIVVGLALALGGFGLRSLRRRDDDAYDDTRQSIGRSILSR